MRHRNIELNWRVRPLPQPRVLKGHDDHVITCLQFCANRIVSGSDDNTLKVWSATTGKVRALRSLSVGRCSNSPSRLSLTIRNVYNDVAVGVDHQVPSSQVFCTQLAPHFPVG